MTPMLKVKNTFISVDALEGDVEGTTKAPRQLMSRSRSQGCLVRETAESEGGDQIEKLNRILGSDKEAVREARSPVKTSPAGTATPPSSEESTTESVDYTGGMSELSELKQLQKKLEQVCAAGAASPQAARPRERKASWACDTDACKKSMDRNASNASVSTMTSFEANRSRACSNGSITDCWTENNSDEPVEFDLTIEEEPAAFDAPDMPKKRRPNELYGVSRSNSGSSWDSGGEQKFVYGPTSWFRAEAAHASMGCDGSPFNTPMPSPSQWAQEKCHGYKDKPSRGLPRESRHNRVPKNVNLQAEFQSQSAEITTLMIRNIPNRYTQRELMQELEEMGFADKFDFLYSPLDKGTMSNVGYAFVNFKTAQWASQCMQAFQSYRFKRHRKTSGKVAAVSAAHLQGLEANLAHYEKTAVNSAKMKQRRPMVLAAISGLASDF